MGTRAIAIAMALALLVGGLAAGQTASAGATVPGQIVGTSARDDGGLTLRYRAVGASGDVVVQTAALWTPDREPSGAVVAWAHPTAGLADKCAPSHQDTIPVPGLQRLLDAGHTVVAPDYEGLRGEGVHPYLVGDSAGRSVLDAIRAARLLTGAAGPSAIFGWSQGGHAALFATRLASSYAPEIQLRGAVALAPVTDMASLVDGTSPFSRIPGFVAMLATGYEATYDELDADDLFRGELPELDEVRSACALHVVQAFDGISVGAPTSSWQARLAQNDPASAPVAAPVLLVHGDGDPLLPVTHTVRAQQRLCALGSTAELYRYADGDHVNVVAGGSDDWLGWLESRLRGEPTGGCEQRQLTLAQSRS